MDHFMKQNCNGNATDIQFYDAKIKSKEWTIL